MRIRTAFFAALSVLALGSAAQAAPVDPTTGVFGDLGGVGTDVTFDGDDIPTADSNYQTFSDRSGNTLLLGLSITPRFSAPTPNNDLAGTFDVQPGLGGSPNGPGLFWNFSYYAELFPTVGSALTIADIGLQLLYDLDSAVGTDIADLGVLDITLFQNTTSTIAQGSQNLSFAYLSANNPGFNTPGLNTFSPDFGEYSFLLRATDFSVTSGSGVAVIADAGMAPIPLPAGFPLLLAGIGALVFVRLRRDQTA